MELGTYSCFNMLKSAFQNAEQLTVNIASVCAWVKKYYVAHHHQQRIREASKYLLSYILLSMFGVSSCYQEQQQVKYPENKISSTMGLSNGELVCMYLNPLRKTFTLACRPILDTFILIHPFQRYAMLSSYKYIHIRFIHTYLLLFTYLL